MRFVRDSGVSSVLKSSCMCLYTPVLRAALPCSHEQITIINITLNSLNRKSVTLPKGETLHEST